MECHTCSSTQIPHGKAFCEICKKDVDVCGVCLIIVNHITNYRGGLKHDLRISARKS